LFASHYGWLHSTPDKSQQTRIKALGQGSQFANLPEVKLTYLVELFFDMGMASVDTALKPLNFGEISSYKAASNIEMSPFDIVTIKKMSESYVAWVHKGKAINCQSPFFEDKRTLEQQREETNNKFKSLGRKHGN
tara:strand:- start:1361 stop:1765 length:405 start_codon:yes stop_codon:yes gene_type:complete